MKSRSGTIGLPRLGILIPLVVGGFQPPAAGAPERPPGKEHRQEAPRHPPSSRPETPAPDRHPDPYRVFQEYGRELGRMMLGEANARAVEGTGFMTGNSVNARIKRYSTDFSHLDTTLFFKGRYDRSRARLPGNIEAWRTRPDIANPGADLANWPNSAFTLPAGRAYIEYEPLSYTAGFGGGTPQVAQYAMNFLLRYGLTDNIELRLFGNGPTRTLGGTQAWNFSPLAFDTKIHLWSERRELHLPALGIEAYVQTEWLGNTTTNAGTQPSISFNFDQSLPWDIDLEYNFGAVRDWQQVDGRNANVWQFIFQWALQRDFFDKDLAFFLHGYFNAPTLPRIPNARNPGMFGAVGSSEYQQNVVGAGFIWTVNSRLSLWGQSSAGTNRSTPSLLSNVGFALAF